MSQDSIDQALADLMWWYGWSPSEAENLSLDDVEIWLEQAKRQIKAGYTKSMIVQ